MGGRRTSGVVALASFCQFRVMPGHPAHDDAGKPEEHLVLGYDAPDGRRLVLEDDGRVAYAYLLEHGEIVGDVWLYNVGPDPEEVNWQERADAPLRNPARYCTAQVLPRIDQRRSITCVWSEQGVSLHVDGFRWAYLRKGSKPGWSIKARTSGPLARPFDSP